MVKFIKIIEHNQKDNEIEEEVYINVDYIISFWNAPNGTEIYMQHNKGDIFRTTALHITAEQIASMINEANNG